MEIGMREWLIIIGGLLLLAVLIDGVRRMSSARNGIRMSKGLVGGGFEKDSEESAAELPNGGARVVGFRNPDTGDISPVNTDPLFDNEEVSDEGECRSPGNVGLNNAEDNLGFDPAIDFDPNADFEPDFSNLPIFQVDKKGSDDILHEPSIDAALEGVPETSIPASTISLSTRSVGSNATIDKSLSNSSGTDTSLTSSSLSISDSSINRNTNDTPEAEGELDDVIVISVVAKHPKGFKGEKLFTLLQACGLELGEMGIFHRLEHDTGRGAVQFSVANLVKPGDFDLNQASSFSTPGVTFFLGLPGPDDPMKAFDFMLETAKCVAGNLGGELKDEIRSVMTEQTMDHSRQRVKDFERLQLSLKNA